MNNRISLRAVLPGILISISAMLFLSFALRNLFVLTPEMGIRPPPRGSTVWAALTFAWVFSLFLGALLSSINGRLTDYKNALISGLTVWASCFFILGILISINSAGIEPLLELDQASDFILFRDFFGEVGALISAVLGSLLGVWIEKNDRKRELL